jgi:hypothetical protein
VSKSFVTAEGRLVDRLLPAIYFDASVLVEYWMTDGAEIDLPSEDSLPRPSYEIAMIELLRADKRWDDMVLVRKALSFSELQAFAVTCPLSILELIEWNAEVCFKDLAARAAGTLAVQRKSKKEIGDLLGRVLESRLCNLNEEAGGSEYWSTGLGAIFSDTWLVPGFAHRHGLRGIVIADLVSFPVSEEAVWVNAQVLAYLQMGMADIVQLLAAHHLGCKWFASFDSDFARCSEQIRDNLGLTLLRTPQEILRAFV